MKTRINFALIFAATLSASALVTLAAADQTPKAVVKVAPDYSYDLRRESIKGDVLVSLTVTAQGNVANAVIVNSSDRAFETPTLNAIKKWKFSPGTKDGVAVNTAAMQLVRFRLPWLSADSVSATANLKPAPAAQQVASAK